MKKIIVCTIFTLIFISINAFAMSSDSTTSVYSSFGSFEVDMSSSWISVSLAEVPTRVNTKSCDQYEIKDGFLNFLGAAFIAGALPSLINWRHSPYFINIYEEGSITFSVLYQDSYGNMPSPGYPKVVCWKKGASDTNEIVLTSNGTFGSGYLYSESVNLSNGVYNYKYLAKNDFYPGEYVLGVSSFVVCSRPRISTPDNFENGSTRLSGKVMLEWKGHDPDGGELSFKVYLGNDPNNLQVTYEGESSSYELSSLRANSKYYWRVEAINQYGISTLSPIYSFNTLNNIQKAFNYPNPFRAGRQNTNFVFDMKNDGNVEISVYSELGDLCWRRSFTNLPQGTNQISYDGTDDCGRTLYNGSYVCIIDKKYYAETDERDNCRILVIK